MNDKKIAGIGGIIAAIIVTISVFALTFEPDQDGLDPQTILKNEKLGLVINSPSNEITIQQLAGIYEDAALTGIGRSNVYLFWNLLEPDKNEYNFKNTDVLMSLNKKHSLKVTAFFSIINGKTLGPFPNWIGKPSLNSIPEDELVEILDVILSRYDIIDTLIIAGETDEKFRYQENSIPVYKELFKNVYDKIKGKHPDVKIGNAFSLHGVLNKNLQHVVEELSDGDFVALTYFPVDSVYEISKTPNSAKDDLEKIFEFVPNKKVAFFEISWSTSDFVGGNTKQQVEFLKVAYDFYNENNSKFEFFTWYRQYDRQEGTCKIDPESVEEPIGLGASNEFVIERLENYICNAGLINSDGTSKSGWSEFKNQIEKISS